MNSNPGETKHTWNRNRLASLYFATQAILGLLWWIGIASRPAFAKYFFSTATVTTDLKTFALADLHWFVVMSGLASVVIWRQLGIAYPIVMCLLGAVGYAFFCCIGMVFNGGPWLSVALMCGSFIGTAFFAISIAGSWHDKDSSAKHKDSG